MNSVAERTDTATGRRFAATFGDRVRFVQSWGWLVYRDGRWASDGRQTVRLFSKALASELVEEAAAEPDEVRRKPQIQFAASCLDNYRQQAMLKAAESEPPIAAEPEDFDRDPWLFNCQNKTLDLRTAEARPHNPAHLITMTSPVIYDASASCPRWLAHLGRTFGGCVETIGLYQRWLGYCLTGLTREQVFLIEAGPPATGKSVNRETGRYLLGDYAAAVSMDALMARPHGTSGGARPDLAKLRGKRSATATETAAGRRFDEALIKSLTAGDTFPVRGLYEKEFDLKPEFKLSISTNYVPMVSTDPAVWRRVIILPYPHPIPEAERDLILGERLKAEASGILNWMLAGCLAWQREGLNIPAVVRAATAAQRARLDGVAGFIADRCIVRPGARSTAAELHREYAGWCESAGTEAMGKTPFGRSLSDHGFEPGGKSGSRLGLRLRTPQDPPISEGGEEGEVYTLIPYRESLEKSTVEPSPPSPPEIGDAWEPAEATP